MKQYRGLPNVYDKPAVYELGRLSVTLFFVLSGFLITYLLLVEKQRSGQIAVRRFYLRRILRIWPLYFLVVLASFLLLPHLDAFQVPRYTDGDGRALRRDVHAVPALSAAARVEHLRARAVRRAGVVDRRGGAVLSALAAADEEDEELRRAGRGGDRRRDRRAVLRAVDGPGKSRGRGGAARLELR